MTTKIRKTLSWIFAIISIILIGGGIGACGGFINEATAVCLVTIGMIFDFLSFKVEKTRYTKTNE